MKKSRIALVEIGGSHDECLLTQMHAIQKGGHDLVLITTKDVAERNPTFSKYLEETVIVNAEKSNKALVKEVWKHLKELNIDKTVLNTAQGKVIRDLCLKAYLHPMEFIGIIHTTRMFTESFTQKIIHRKIKKYFLLSEQLLKQVTPPKNVSIDYFYPLRFPTENRIVEKRNKVVAIIGGVEERRKDLEGFIQMMQPLKDENIRFVFLGRSDASKPEVPLFLNRLEEEGLTDMVHTYNQFVSQETFDATLQNVDLILPLVHPNTPSADQYFRNQISGAMTVSFGYKIPMLIHTAYHSITEMQPASFYYELESFSSVLKNALENAENKREEMRKHLPYTTDEQEKRYLEFLAL